MRAGSTFPRRQPTLVFAIVLVLHVLLLYLVSTMNGIWLKPSQDTQPLTVSFVQEISTQPNSANPSQQAQPAKQAEKKAIKQKPTVESKNKPLTEKPPPQSLPQKISQPVQTKASPAELKKTTVDTADNKTTSTGAASTDDTSETPEADNEQPTQPQQSETESESADPLAAAYAQQQKDIQAENDLLDAFSQESAQQQGTEAFGQHLDFPASSNWGKLEDEPSHRPDAIYTHQVRAKHPEDERLRGREGIVAIEFTIDTEGAVIAESINIFSATSDSFAFEATVALLASSFQVRMVEGVAVTQEVKTSIVFPLD